MGSVRRALVEKEKERRRLCRVLDQQWKHQVQGVSKRAQKRLQMRTDRQVHGLAANPHLPSRDNSKGQPFLR